MAAYYYLLSGLPESDEKTAPEKIEDVQQDIDELLEETDRDAFHFFLYRNDNKNLLRILRDRDGVATYDEVEFYRPCRFSHEDLENALAGVFELPGYMQKFLESDPKIDNEEQLRQRENRLLEMYYEAALNHRSSFVREWFQFKQDLKNIIQAINAKKYGLPLSELLIGRSDLADQLARQPLLDQSLQKLYPYLLTLQDHIENGRMTELEKEIESLLLSFAEEKSALEPFGFSSVMLRFLHFSYDYRWAGLTEQAGKEALNRQIDSILSKANLEFAGEPQ